MRILRPLFFASFFFSIHLALLTYINSSMLERFAGEKLISVFYTLASAGSIVLIFVAPSVIRIWGLIRFTFSILLISALLLLIIGTGKDPYIIVGAFAAYFSLNSLIVYIFDLFIEHFSSEQSTGKTRGLLLTLNSLGWVIAPFASGTVTELFGYGMSYIIAAFAVLISLGIILISQHHYADQKYKTYSFVDSYHAMRHSHPIRRIVTINFILQFFFSWMVLYLPLYMISIVGYDWKTLGALFSIMLLPFVLLQAPIGRFVDKFEERPFIVAGLSIMALCTILFASLGDAPFIIYALVLFGSRVGASTLEVAIDSYFFKRLDDKDVSMISIYRNMVPLAYIIGPMLGALLLVFGSFQMLFFVLSAVLFAGVIYTFHLYRP